MVLLMMVLFVDLPMMVTQRAAYLSMHPEKRIEASQTSNAAKIDLPSTEQQENTEPQPAVEEDTSLKLEYALVMLGISVLQMLIIFSYSVAWYQQLLFNEKKDSTIFFRFGKLEYNFAITAMKAGIVLAPVVFVMISYFMATMPGFSDGEPIVLEDYWWLFLGGAVLLMFLLARCSMSYPLTIMGQFEKPIKLSWDMTKQQPLQIVLGFFSMIIPPSLGMMAIVMAASTLMNLDGQPVQEEIISAKLDFVFVEHLIYRAIGSAYMLVVFALVSAFYARTYAFLVRTKEAAPAA